MSGSKALIEILRDQGVEYVFGLPGSTEALFLDSLYDYPEIKYVLGLHESVALAMAEGYTKASGKVGVVNLHTAIGLSAAMSMLGNAYQSGTPLVVTAGQQDSRLLLQEPRLSGDLKTMARLYTKWSAEVSYVADLPLAMRRAFKVATQKPTGPVFVSLPQDILEQSLDLQSSPNEPFYARMTPDPDTIDCIAELLIKSKMPTIIVGGGVAKYSAVSEVIKLAESIGARVYQEAVMTDINFPANHPQYLGQISRSSPDISETLQSVDALLTLGTQVFKLSTYTPEPVMNTNTKIIQIDDNPWEIAKNYPITAAIQGDIKESIVMLNHTLQENMSDQLYQLATNRVLGITQEKKRLQQPFLKKDLEARNNIPIPVSRLMQELGASLKPGTVVVDDAWTSSTLLKRNLDLDKPGSFYRSHGGCIGAGMPMSLGVQLARPDESVVGVIGDGSAIWSCQSLWTAAHYNLPVTFIICANAGYQALKNGRVRQMGKQAKDRFLGLDFDQPRIDFSQLAQAMGIQGVKVVHPDELGSALNLALELNRPALVEVIIENTV